MFNLGSALVSNCMSTGKVCIAMTIISLKEISRNSSLRFGVDLILCKGIYIDSASRYC